MFIIIMHTRHSTEYNRVSHLSSSRDALQLQLESEGADFLDALCPLYWINCLKVMLLTLSEKYLETLLKAVIDALPDRDQDRFTVGESKEKLLGDLPVEYTLSLASKSTRKSVV